MCWVRRILTPTDYWYRQRLWEQWEVLTDEHGYWQERLAASVNQPLDGTAPAPASLERITWWEPGWWECPPL